VSRYELRIDNPRPYFAELAYYLWDDANYDSEGDCERPTDREWTWIRLLNRESEAHLTVFVKDSKWVVEGTEPDAARAAHFLKSRCDARPLGQDPSESIGDWDHKAAEGRADKVREVFERSELEPFDNDLFWGSWKWIGWRATEFTWVGRWIMHSVLTNDPRAVPLAIHWLREGTVDEKQSQALRYALNRLTGKEFESDDKWVGWYEAQGQERYPEPDYDEWLEDLKSQFWKKGGIL
jgi:hypothetical protein